jgi:hypothetical protein
VVYRDFRIDCCNLRKKEERRKKKLEEEEGE